MKFTKFLAIASLSALGLMASVPYGQSFALDPKPIFSDREHIKNLDTEDKGLAVFRWQISEGTETHTKCAWVVLDESKLQSNLNLTAPQLDYLRVNQFEVTDISSLRENISDKAYDYLTSPDNHFNGFAHYSLMIKNWSSDIYSSMVSELAADAPKPEELSFDGVVFYLYKGWFGIWSGYIIHDYNAFRNWCKAKELNNDQIKILAACQNTWISGKSTFFTQPLPQEFFNTLNAVRDKDPAAESPKTYVHIDDGTRFGAVIYNTPDINAKITWQLYASKISPESVEVLRHPWNLDWRKPITWRIETLRNNKDIQ